MKRLDHDADTPEDIKAYARSRALQVIGYGAFLKGFEEKPYGGLISWEYQNKEYHSLFLRPSFRGKGIYLQEIKKHGYKILTVPDCAIEEFLREKQIEHVVLNRFMETEEYKAIESFYGSAKAKRSQVFLMNHIDEGLAILDFLGASEVTKKAYCLHPLTQEDKTLKNSFENLDFSSFDPKALVLALEYRNIANDYLSPRSIDSLEDIRLSPLEDVQTMLKADKIQNYKDFLLYQKNHPRNKELDLYFKNWLKKLAIDQIFHEYNKALIIPEL